MQSPCASIPSYPAMIVAKPIAPGETSERSLISACRISRARHIALHGGSSDFDNPFTKESKHVPRGASSLTSSVGMIDKIVGAKALRSMIGERISIGWREMRSLLPANPTLLGAAPGH